MAKAVGRAAASSSKKKPRHTAAQKKAAARTRELRGSASATRYEGRPPRVDRDRAASGGASAERSERPRYDRGAGADRADRPRFDRAERTDRPRYDRNERTDRPRFDRSERTERPSFTRDDRPRYDRNERTDRPRFDRNERTDRPRFDRNERTERPSFSRDDRPRFDRNERTDRPRFDRNERTDRPRFDRNERTERPSFTRDDRPRYDRNERTDRPSFSRDDRPRFDRNERTDRPRFDRSERTDRPRFDRNERTDRPRYDRNERTERPSFSRDDRPRFDRAERPRFERAERRPEQHQRLEQQHDRQEVRRHPAAPAVEIVRGEALEKLVAEGPFATFGVDAALVRKLAELGITEPFPIQAAAIPDALAGRDILGRGQTGSGKTMAFGLPTAQLLAAGTAAKPHRPRALVLTPTRELAMQVTDALRPLLDSLRLRYMLIAGGMSYTPQLTALDRGVDVLIATPGRLIDLIERGAADLSEVQITTLDEADHMAQMGFLEAITQILDLTPREGQRLLFSATLDHGIASLADTYLHDPVTHETDAATASVSTMEHHLFLVHPHHKKTMIAAIANREGRTVAFVRTKLGADRVAEQLREQGVFAAALHGGLNQAARNRVLSAFKSGELPVLVATDVAARGIHVDDVSLVLQVDPPADHKDYLHRSGRTARAGDRGAVVTLALPHQKRMVSKLLEQAGVDTEAMTVAPDDETVITTAGGRMPSGEPIPYGRLEALLAPKRPQRGGRRPSGPRGGQGRGPRRSPGSAPASTRW